MMFTALSVPRMRRNAPRLGRGALLIRGPGLLRIEDTGIPDLRSGMAAMQVHRLRMPQRVRETMQRPPYCTLTCVMSRNHDCGET
jgi:hypothetical protein